MQAQLNISGDNLSLTDFDEAKRLFPNNPDVHIKRGQIFAKMKDKEPNAYEEYKKAVNISPNNVTANLGKHITRYILIKKTQITSYISTVISEIQDALIQIPNCLEKFLLKIMLLEDQQLYWEANTVFEKAISLFPRTPALYLNYARFMLKWKDDEAAFIRLLNKTIELNDKYAAAYVELGLFKVNHECMDEAKKAFLKALPGCEFPMDVLLVYQMLYTASTEFVACKKLGVKRSKVFGKFPFSKINNIL